MCTAPIGGELTFQDVVYEGGVDVNTFAIVPVS